MPKAHCKNCGDETNFNRTSPERTKVGWCSPCFRQWQKLQTKRGDASRELYNGPSFNPRPPENWAPAWRPRKTTKETPE